MSKSLTCVLVTLSSRRAVALLALRVAEEAWLAPGALSADDVWLAGALSTDLRTVVADASGHVAVALQGAVVELASHGDDEWLAFL